MKPGSMLNFEQLLTLSWIFNGTALTINRLIIPQLKKNPYYYILILFECCMYIFDHKDLSHIKHTVDNWIILIVSSSTNGTLQINNFCYLQSRIARLVLRLLRLLTLPLLLLSCLQVSPADFSFSNSRTNVL